MGDNDTRSPRSQKRPRIAQPPQAIAVEPVTTQTPENLTLAAATSCAARAILFDIGANVGSAAVEALEADPNCDVVCLEPNPALIANLHAIASAYGSRMRVIEAAADGTDGGLRTLYVLDVAQGALSSLDEHWTGDAGTGRFKSMGHDRSHQVATRSLNSLICEFGTPDLIKLDIEGFEEAVLLGLATPADNRLPREICWEWQEEQACSSVRILQHLAQLGFTSGAVAYKDKISRRYLRRPEPEAYMDIAELIVALPAKLQKGYHADYDTGSVRGTRWWRKGAHLGAREARPWGMIWVTAAAP